MLYTLLSFNICIDCSVVSAKNTIDYEVTLHLYYYLHVFISRNYELKDCEKE